MGELPMKKWIGCRIYLSLMFFYTVDVRNGLAG